MVFPTFTKWTSQFLFQGLVRWYFSFLIQIIIIGHFIANTEYLDQTPCFVASDIGWVCAVCFVPQKGRYAYIVGESYLG